MTQFMYRKVVAVLWIADVSLATLHACDSAHLAKGLSCAQPAEPSGSSLLQRASGSKADEAKLVKGTKEWMAAGLQQEIAQSEKLSLMFSSLSKKDNVPDKTKQLFGLFRICATCSHFARLGEQNDGGYLTCMDHNASNPSLAAFSLGVEHHDQWSEDVVTILGAKKVLQYDCTIQTPPAACPRCNFHRKCIRGASQIAANDDSSWTLQEAIENAGFKDAADDSLIMKMDIEGSEWDTLKEFPKKDLQKFKQIAIEYHDLNAEHDHDKYVLAQTNLKNNGFVPVHIHGNNYQGMYTVGDLTIPNVLEVTYLRVSQADRCVADQVFRSLDAPNNPSAHELPAAHMEAP
jgi:hypothetical protein